MSWFPGVTVTKHHELSGLFIYFFSLALLEARSLRSGCQQGNAPSEGSRE